MSRVASFAQFSLIQQTINRTQERIFDRQAQVASGHVSPDFAGIASESHQLVSIKAAAVKAQSFIDQNNQLDGRLQVMDGALGNIGDLASTLKTRIIQRLNSATGSASPIGREASDILASVTGLLNTQMSGRFVFAGAMTDTRPIANPVPDPATFGVPSGNYYQGDSTELTARVSETLEVKIGLAGNRQGFQDLIASLKAVIQGAATNDSGLIETSLDLVTSAIDQINGYRAELGTAASSIARATSGHQDFQLHAQNIVSDIQNVDVPSAVTALAADQTALEASFITVARISQLSLVDFLR